MKGWVDEKLWADQWKPLIEAELRPIVGDIVKLVDATAEQDRTEGFDYRIHTRLGDVAARIRRPCTYRDITIRSILDSGFRTEIDKLRLGHAQLYFYGWSNGAERAFDDFCIFDVERFLAAMLFEANPPDIPNGDGTWFRAIDAAQLFTVPGCVLRSSKTLIPAVNPPGQLSLLYGEGIR